MATRVPPYELIFDYTYKRANVKVCPLRLLRRNLAIALSVKDYAEKELSDSGTSVTNRNDGLSMTVAILIKNGRIISVRKKIDPPRKKSIKFDKS